MAVPEMIRWIGEDRCIGVLKNSVALFPAQSYAELVPIAVFFLRFVILSIANVVTLLVRQKEARYPELVISAFAVLACFFECVSNYKHEKARRQKADKRDKLEKEIRILRDKSNKKDEDIAKKDEELALIKEKIGSLD
uniref:Uncharacterized protein n=1 Tax=Ditylenchus dipsaci TaxID=166011 RepID=A0A915D145_9BILA